MAGRQQDFYTLARNHSKAIWDGINALVALQREWQALDYGNTLEPGSGANAGLTDTEVGAGVFDTSNAMVAFLAGGHATNRAEQL